MKNSSILTPQSIIMLVFFWAVVIVFQIYGSSLLSDLTPLKAILVFSLLLATILAAAFAVVKQADKIAEILGEPYGTLILTLCIVIIEVVLIVSMLLGTAEHPTIAKDSVFSIMMIIINLVIGVCLIIGGRKFGVVSYNSQGTFTYLGMIITLGGIGMILPGFLDGKGGGELTTVQAIGFASITILVYGAFLFYQVTRYSYLYIQPTGNKMSLSFGHTSKVHGEAHQVVNKGEVLKRSVVLVFFILPIVLLAHNLGYVVDYGIEQMQLPVSLSGILIAIIVFTPESAAAIKAILNNEVQRAINLCHGAFVSTVGLTFPAVLIIGLIMDKQVILGLSPTEIILFSITLLLSFFCFSGKRTSPIFGVLHLAVFAIYLLLVFNS